MGTLTGPRWFPPQFEECTQDMPEVVLPPSASVGREAGLSLRKRLRQPWETLAAILEKMPAMNLMAQQAELLDWLEQHQDSHEEGTLEYWIMDRLANLLADGEDDTL